VRIGPQGRTPWIVTLGAVRAAARP
jgi:hypothetical protein